MKGHIPTGLEKMISAAKAQKKLTPDEVLKGDKKAKLMLQLADIYYEARDFDHGVRLYDLVISRSVSSPGKVQLSWAHFMKGRSLYGKLEPLPAKKEYLAAAMADKNAPWYPKAMFFAANVAQNYDRDTEQAISIWKKIIQTRPKAPEAERAMYYVAVAYQWAKKFTESRRAYEAFLKKHPGSVYVKPIRQHHLPRLTAAEEKAGVAGKKGTQKETNR